MHRMYDSQRLFSNQIIKVCLNNVTYPFNGNTAVGKFNDVHYHNRLIHYVQEDHYNFGWNSLIKCASFASHSWHLYLEE